MHSLPLLYAENAEPTAHARHWRSTIAEPALDCPEPSEHVDQVAHASLPVVALNDPGWHTAQVRSLVAVGERSLYSPIGQSLRTGEHAVPSSLVEKVLPTVHGVQTRSAVAEPAFSMPDPSGHVCQVTHEALPSPALNAPSVHSVQARFEESLGFVVSYHPAGQIATWQQPRFELDVGGTHVYCPVAQLLIVSQIRSDETVAAMLSYCCAVQ